MGVASLRDRDHLRKKRERALARTKSLRDTPPSHGGSPLRSARDGSPLVRPRGRGASPSLVDLSSRPDRRPRRRRLRLSLLAELPSLRPVRLDGISFLL